MSAGVEITGFIMVIISWLIIGTSLANDHWKISTVSGSVITSQRTTENLWHSCAENSLGMAQCKDFESMLDLPAHIAGCRALMIIALLLGLTGILVSVFGLKCINVGSATEQSKAKMGVAGGVISILAGLCPLIACSWYAYRVVQDFYNPLIDNMNSKYELGTGLFLGWAGACLAILGGGLLCSAITRTKSKSSQPPNYNRAPQKIYKSETETAKSFV